MYLAIWVFGPYVQRSLRKPTILRWIQICIGYLCDNYVPQWWVELDNELSWLFTNRLSAEILRSIWLFSANEINQLIIELNSSLISTHSWSQLMIAAHNCHTGYYLIQKLPLGQQAISDCQIERHQCFVNRWNSNPMFQEYRVHKIQSEIYLATNCNSDSNTWNVNRKLIMVNSFLKFGLFEKGTKFEKVFQLFEITE